MEFDGPSHHNPTGWMAIQHCQPLDDSCVALIFRLGLGDPEKHFRLRSLKPEQCYDVLVDGTSVGSRTGEGLAKQGLIVQLLEQWRGTVIEILPSAGHTDSAEDSPLKILPYADVPK